MADAAQAASRFRPFRVVSRTPESRTITSFALEPLDPADWRAFDPGQYLPIRIPGTNGQASALRTYSISSAPADTARYRITVKREGAPAPGLPDGIGSCYLHDRIAVPVNADRCELGELLARDARISASVDVFDSHQESPAGAARKQPGDQCGAQVTEMQTA